jgi:hypothetical protein
MYVVLACCYLAKRPNLKLKTRLIQLLSYLPLDIVLPGKGAGSLVLGLGITL